MERTPASSSSRSAGRVLRNPVSFDSTKAKSLSYSPYSTRHFKPGASPHAAKPARENSGALRLPDWQR